jgi:caspase domain-containing protein
MREQLLIWMACLYAFASIFSAPVQGQDRCGAGKDLMFQALERIRTSASAEAENGVQLLKDATDLCPTSGDAWYYRSLFERKLNRIPKADYALRKAQMFDSDALRDHMDPFTLAAPPGPSNRTSGPPRQKWALVIGISKFEDPQVPRLNYPGKDAEDFASLLKDPNVGRFKAGNVHMLVDKYATTHNIKAELNWLARNAQADDLVVIFVSTHGSPRELDSRDVNYIVTSDTKIKPQDELFATALGMVELTQVVRSRILARRTAILLDTCHSGAAASAKSADLKESSVSSKTLDSIRQGAGRAIITSSQVGESSWEDDEDQNGYFTHYLVQALRQSKGRDPIQKIFTYVHDQVSQSVLAKYKVKQEPVLSRSDGDADIVIGAESSGG